MTRYEAEDIVLGCIRSFEAKHEQSPACVRVGRIIWRAMVAGNQRHQLSSGGVTVMIDLDVSDMAAVPDPFEN